MFFLGPTVCGEKQHVWPEPGVVRLPMQCAGAEDNAELLNLLPGAGKR